MSTKWSAPFYGIQHLDGVRQGYQFTVSDRELFAQSAVFVPGRGFNADVRQHPDAATARAYLEKQASELQAVAA